MIRTALAGAMVVAIKMGWPLFVKGLHAIFFHAGAFIGRAYRQRRSPAARAGPTTYTQRGDVGRPRR